MHKTICCPNQSGSNNLFVCINSYLKVVISEAKNDSFNAQVTKEYTLKEKRTRCKFKYVFLQYQLYM